MILWYSLYIFISRRLFPVLFVTSLGKAFFCTSVVIATSLSLQVSNMFFSCFRLVQTPDHPFQRAVKQPLIHTGILSDVMPVPFARHILIAARWLNKRFYPAMASHQAFSVREHVDRIVNVLVWPSGLRHHRSRRDMILTIRVETSGRIKHRDVDPIKRFNTN